MNLRRYINKQKGLKDKAHIGFTRTDDFRQDSINLNILFVVFESQVIRLKIVDIRILLFFLLNLSSAWTASSSLVDLDTLLSDTLTSPLTPAFSKSSLSASLESPSAWWGRSLWLVSSEERGTGVDSSFSEPLSMCGELGLGELALSPLPKAARRGEVLRVYRCSWGSVKEGGSAGSWEAVSTVVSPEIFEQLSEGSCGSTWKPPLVLSSLASLSWAWPASPKTSTSTSISGSRDSTASAASSGVQFLSQSIWGLCRTHWLAWDEGIYKAR